MNNLQEIRMAIAMPFIINPNDLAYLDEMSHEDFSKWLETKYIEKYSF